MRTELPLALAVVFFSGLFSILDHVHGEEERLSPSEVLAILPRGVDMDDARDIENFNKLVKMGPAVHGILGEKLLSVDNPFTAGRIVALFVSSTGEKTVARKYLERFLALPGGNGHAWQLVRNEAASAIREFEAAHAAAAPSSMEGVSVVEPAPPPTQTIAPLASTAVTPAEQSASSRSWIIVVAVIVTATGLLWMLLQRRS